MPGRLITDNILIAFEIMHYLKRKRRGNKGEVTIKIDMNKAYDRIEWYFLRSIIAHMGFDKKKWVELIMICIKMVHFNIMYRRQDINLIILEKGL